MRQSFQSRILQTIDHSFNLTPRSARSRTRRKSATIGRPLVAEETRKHLDVGIRSEAEDRLTEEVVRTRETHCHREDEKVLGLRSALADAKRVPKYD
jgi:hypothetical protein